jgi:hypothetical protein
MKSIHCVNAFAALVAQTVSAAEEPWSPLDNLPANIEKLTSFGERPSISPDGKEVAFIGKTFGDAFAIDLKTRLIRCLTCEVENSAFLRVMHLSNGDYLLIGPKPGSATKGVNLLDLRQQHSDLWILRNKPGAEPEPLGVNIEEGVAVSKRRLKLGWVVSYRQDHKIPDKHYQLFVADLSLDGAPHLVGTRQVHKSVSPPCHLEAQDFRNDDRELLFQCASFPGPDDVRAKIVTIDLTSGKLKDHSNAEVFDEPEGISFDGSWIVVESDRQARSRGEHAWRDGWPIDLYRLELDGTGKKWTRLTSFNDRPGWNAGNAVVSPDGRFMAFAVGRQKDGGHKTGAGLGILLQWFDKAKSAAR